MFRFNRFPRFLSSSLKLVTLASFPALGLLLVNASPTPARDYGAFQLCAEELLAVRISQENAATACAQALEPKDLSLCVIKIDGLTPIESQAALAGCFRVRQPVEFASCVVDINKDTDNPIPLETLDYCRRSLLPRRYAECVIGLDQEVNISTNQALETCIAAEDFPRVLYRN